MRYEVRVEDRVLTVDLDGAGRFLIDGTVVAAELVETVRSWQWQVRIGGQAHEVTVVTRTEPLRLLVDGIEIVASAIDERAIAASRGARSQTAGRHEVRAPMPGLLKAVHVREGDIVESGAALVTLEAMKMENELLAPSAGRIAKVGAAAGAKVEAGAVLIVITSD